MGETRRLPAAWRAWATPVSASLLLAACAGLPGVTAPLHFRDAAALTSAQSFAASDAPWPRVDWWAAYSDAQLASLIAEGLSNSPSLAEARARLASAQAVVDATRGGAGPQLDLNAAVNEQKQSYNSGIPPAFVPHGYQDAGRVTLDFSYSFDFWGRNRSAIAAAASDARAAEAESAQARLTLSTAIAAAYADLARLYAERDIAAQALDVRTQTVDLVRRRVDLGLDNRGALAQAEAGPPTVRADLAALDESIAQTRNALAALVGAGPDRGLSIERPSAAAPQAFGLPATLAADLVGRRPDIVAARWRAEAAFARIGEARAAFYPNVNLTAFIGAQALGIENLTESGSDVGQIGPALSLPIFDSGRIHAQLRRADAERDAAVASYDAALTQALHEIADVAVSERALNARLSETQTALAAQEEAYRITRARYEGGLSNYQAVLIAEDALLGQRRALADLQSRRFILDVALVRALGGGFAPQQEG